MQCIYKIVNARKTVQTVIVGHAFYAEFIPAKQLTYHHQQMLQYA